MRVRACVGVRVDVWMCLCARSCACVRVCARALVSGSSGLQPRARASARDAFDAVDVGAAV